MTKTICSKYSFHIFFVQDFDSTLDRERPTPRQSVSLSPRPTQRRPRQRPINRPKPRQRHELRLIPTLRPPQRLRPNF